jgi:hypothetical protein
MKTIIARRAFAVPALVSVLALVATPPATAVARPSGAAERTARQEERAQARAQRRQEAQERHAARAQERAARRAARHADAPAGSEQTGSEGNAAEEPGAPVVEPSSRGCRVTLQASAPRVLAGETVELTGALSCPSTTVTADRSLTLTDHQGRTTAPFAAIKPVVSAADGSFTTVSPPLEANTIFQVQLGRHHARATVKVAPTVTLVAPAPPAQSSSRTHGAHSRRVTFTGAVTPAGAAKLVALQVDEGSGEENWRGVAYARVAPDGTFAVSHSFPAGAQTRVRAIVHGPGIVAGLSEPVTYAAVQAQNPSLTIAASRNPLSFGESLTISGVAAGAPGQRVKLLAIGSGAPAVLAEASTGSAGEYTFTVIPSHDTVYAVRAGAVESTMLVESVGFLLAAGPAPAPVQAGVPVSFSGTVTPAVPGANVVLERRSASGSAFHPIGSAALATDGSYAISQTFAVAGTAVLRLRVPGRAGLRTTLGAPFSIDVTG